MVMKHELKEIVKGTVAKLEHVCNGKADYRINVNDTIYQLEINIMEKEWENIYILPEYKSITLMRWIRKGIENGNLIQLN